MQYAHTYFKCKFPVTRSVRLLAGRYVIISLKAGYFFMGRKSHIAFSPSQSLAPSFAVLIARYTLRTFPETGIPPFQGTFPETGIPPSRGIFSGIGLPYIVYKFLAGNG